MCIIRNDKMLLQMLAKNHWKSCNDVMRVFPRIIQMPHRFFRCINRVNMSVYCCWITYARDRETDRQKEGGGDVVDHDSNIKTGG